MKIENVVLCGTKQNQKQIKIELEIYLNEL